MKLAKIESVYRPNLLVNGDFQINQRGQTSYTSTDVQSSLTVDCWRIGGQATLTVNDDNVILSATGDGESYLAQHIDKDLTGKKLSVAVKVTNDKVYTGTITVTDVETVFISDGQWMTVSAKYDSNRNGTQLYINVSGGHSYPFDYVSAFEGEIIYSHFEEDNATALMRCLPYYRRVYMGYTAYALNDNFSMISAQSIAPMLNDSPTITTNVGNRTNVGVANYTYDASGALILTATASAAGAIRIYNEIVELSCEVQ